MLKQIKSMYQYNTWANQRMFDTASRLTGEQFLGQNHATFGTLQHVMVHIVSVQRVWLSRVQAQPRPVDLIPAGYANVDEIRDVWTVIDSNTHQFLNGLADQDIHQICHYVNNAGEPQAYPLWQILFHQLNHATQHRSEAALVMSSLGYSTGWLDYLIYVDETRKT